MKMKIIALLLKKKCRMNVFLLMTSNMLNTLIRDNKLLTLCKTSTFKY